MKNTWWELSQVLGLPGLKPGLTVGVGAVGGVFVVVPVLLWPHNETAKAAASTAESETNRQRERTEIIVPRVIQVCHKLIQPGNRSGAGPQLRFIRDRRHLKFPEHVPGGVSVRTVGAVAGSAEDTDTAKPPAVRLN
ncbi:MAG: hypothetical protein WBW33_00335 [Bryobacteraceae bacterium]